MKHGQRLSSTSLTAAWVPQRASHRHLWRTAAYRVGELDRNGRAALSGIVIQYALDHQTEEGAQKPSDVELLIAEWRSVAQRISALTDGPRDEAKHRADAFLATGGISVTALSELAGRILFLTREEQPKKVIESLVDDGYFKPGAAWDRFADKLVDFYEGHTGKAASAGKGNRKGFSPSVFVKFVHTVQSFLPWQYWQHPKRIVQTQAENALGTELNGAVAKVLARRRTAGPKASSIAA